MIGSDDVLACFVAGNAFTIEYSPRLPPLNKPILTQSTATGSV